MTTKETILVIYESPNGRDNWRPLQANEVPQWVLHPDVMGHLVAGEMCSDPTRGEKGSNWYRAERTPEDAAMVRRAQQRRDQRLARNRRLASRIIQLSH